MGLWDYVQGIGGSIPGVTVLSNAIQGQGPTWEQAGIDLYKTFDPMGGMQIQSAYSQSQAAADAERRAAAAGATGAAGIQDARQQAMDAARLGQVGSLAEYQAAYGDVARQQAGLAPMYQGQINAGQAAIAQLQAAQGGDPDAVMLDPGAQFRAAELQRALDRQAAASGMYGGGAHVRATLREQQDLASREYSNAYNRLMGLAATGQNAAQDYANLNRGYSNMMLDNLGAQAGLYNRGGALMGQIEQNAAADYANSLNRTAGQRAGYVIGQGNAVAQGAAGLNNSAQQGLQTYMYFANRGQ